MIIICLKTPTANIASQITCVSRPFKITLVWVISAAFTSDETGLFGKVSWAVSRSDLLESKWCFCSFDKWISKLQTPNPHFDSTDLDLESGPHQAYFPLRTAIPHVTSNAMNRQKYTTKAPEWPQWSNSKPLCHHRKQIRKAEICTAVNQAILETRKNTTWKHSQVPYLNQHSTANGTYGYVQAIN